MKTRILLIDDHPMMRDGLQMRIDSQNNWETCGFAETEDEGCDLISQMSPDLVLLDISLKIGNGIDLIKRVRSKNSSIKFLVISAHKESLYGERALRAGASGFLNKQQSNDMLIHAIRTILKGGKFISTELQEKLITSALGDGMPTKDPLEQLTDREKEVFRLIGEGFTTGIIAEQLFLSTHTIDTHREHIKRKLGITTAAELSRAAFQVMLDNS